jgi:hypothetical protein
MSILIRLNGHEACIRQTRHVSPHVHIVNQEDEDF